MKGQKYTLRRACASDDFSVHKKVYILGADRKCHYTFISAHFIQKGLKRATLTSINRDKSSMLLSLITNHLSTNENRMIGEFQFLFADFLLSRSLRGYFQWKRIIRLALSSADAILQGYHEDIFKKFFDTLWVQLPYVLVTDARTQRLESEATESGITTNPPKQELFRRSFLKPSFFVFVDDIESAGINVLTCTEDQSQLERVV